MNFLNTGIANWYSENILDEGVPQSKIIESVSQMSCFEIKSYRNRLQYWSEIITDYMKQSLRILASQEIVSLYGTRKSITVYIKASHWILFWSSWNQNTVYKEYIKSNTGTPRNVENLSSRKSMQHSLQFSSDCWKLMGLSG